MWINQHLEFENIEETWINLLWLQEENLLLYFALIFEFICSVKYILSLFSWVHEWTKEIISRKYLFTYLPKFCTSNGWIRLAPVTVKPEEVYTSGNNRSFNNKVTSLWKLCIKTLLVVLVDLNCVLYICLGYYRILTL